MNYKVILHTLGWVLNIEGIAMILPLICSLCYSEWNMAKIFLICIAICLAVGVSLTIKPLNKKTMYAKEGFICVGLSWIILSIFGSLPFIFSGTASVVDSLFETASGFTTTGASILTDVEALPKGLIFWRSFTHWLGGMGVLVFLVALLPLAGGSNLHLIKAESPGPSVSKLVPKVRSTAKILYLMYLALTVLQIIFLLFGGFDLFEALTISFGTAGTGGFGILNSGCAEYSPYIQWIITIFMILLMFSGAMAGSTGGGIKVSRIMILFKSAKKEVFSTIHPNATKKVTIDGRPVEHQVVRGVNNYMAAYVLIFAASVLLISIDNFSPTTNFTAVLAAINNIGPGLEAVGPTQNFSIFSDFSTIVLTADMIIGRLEIFPFLVLLAPSTWRK